jgi:hypothetical protein
MFQNERQRIDETNATFSLAFQHLILGRRSADRSPFVDTPASVGVGSSGAVRFFYFEKNNGDGCAGAVTWKDSFD